MSREEFLRILREKLEGSLEARQIQPHLQYYDQYITEEMRKGRSEEEVTASLGDPRLIARTLIDTSESSGGRGYGDYGDHGDYREDPEPRPSSQEQTAHSHIWRLDLGTWYGKLLLILGAVLLIALVVTVLSALLPILLILFLVSVALRYFRNR